MSFVSEVGSEADDLAPQGLIHATLLAAAVGVVMFFVCWGSIAIPSRLGPGVPIWPANAVAIAMLLSARQRRWPTWLLAVWLGDLAASLVSGESVVMSIALSACNLVAIIVSSYGVRRFAGNRLDLTRSGHLLRFTLIAGVAAPVIAAIIAGVTLGGLEKRDTWATLGTWVAANGLGAIIVVPLLLTLREQRRELAQTPLTPRGWFALGVLAVTALFVFSSRQPLGFLIPPALLLVVFQLEMLGAAWGVVLVMAIAAGCNVLGLGPLAVMGHRAPAAVLVAQLFLAAITLMSLPTAAALAQRRRLQAQVTANAAQTAELYRRAKLAEEVAGVGYWRMEIVSRKIAWSETMAVTFGLDPAAPPNIASIVERLTPEDRDQVSECVQQATRRHEPVSHQFRIVRPDGEMRHLLGKTSAERDASGKVVAIFGTTIDITEMKRAEAELRAAREAAEAAAAVKGDFLANMSHELRTPLTSVIGFTRLALEQPDLNDTSRGYISKASNAGTALLSTVNDILDFSKLESGQLQIRLEPCDPVGVCQETLDLFCESAAAKGVSLRFKAGALPDRLALDPNRLRQLLLNLIGNAVKFSDDGEVVVVVDWREGDQRLAVSVKDQGPGIAIEQQSLLFRRFSQVDGSSTRRHGGTGLGLAICLGLVEAMGGEIGVESQPGHGARFYFEIPALQAATPLAEAPQAMLQFPVQVRVLVADDHPANRELVRAVLTPFGADICEAANGAEAVTVAQDVAFDLILMDLRMPVLDGLSAMKLIRQGEGPNRDAPILAFSAGADAPGAAARLEAGFDGDLSKPVLPGDLISAVCLFAGGRDEDDEAPRQSQSEARG